MHVASIARAGSRVVIDVPHFCMALEVQSQSALMGACCVLGCCLCEYTVQWQTEIVSEPGSRAEAGTGTGACTGQWRQAALVSSMVMQCVTASACKSRGDLAVSESPVARY